MPRVVELESSDSEDLRDIEKLDNENKILETTTISTTTDNATEGTILKSKKEEEKVGLPPLKASREVPLEAPPKTGDTKYTYTRIITLSSSSSEEEPPPPPPPQTPKSGTSGQFSLLGLDINQIPPNSDPQDEGFPSPLTRSPARLSGFSPPSPYAHKERSPLAVVSPLIADSSSPSPVSRMSTGWILSEELLAELSDEKAPEKTRQQKDLKDTSKTKKRKKSGSDKEDHTTNTKKRKKNETDEGIKEKENTTKAKKKKINSEEEDQLKAKPKKDKVKKPRKKLRKTKEEAIQEMLVKIDIRLCEDCQGSQLVDMLKEKKCSVEVLELPVKGSIEWRRDTEEYSTSDVNSVEYVLLWLPGSEVTKLIMDNICLSEFITRLDEFYESKTKYIFLIENLSSWEKAAETLYQRNYRNEVLGIGKDKKSKLSKSDIEEAFISLQMDHNVQIVRTENQQETWAYLCRLTYGIAEKPYKKEPSIFESFCSEASGRKSAKTLSEAWLFQLMQIQSVSKAIGESIVERYPTISSLISVYTSDSLSTKEKQELLADIQIKSRTGEYTNRRLGPALSERIYRVFTETDGSTVI